MASTSSPIGIGHPPFFSFSVECVSVGLKKQTKNIKEITSGLGIGGLVPQHHCCGARKTTRREPKVNMVEMLVHVVVKLRQRGKKDQPPKLLCDIKMV